MDENEYRTLQETALEALGALLRATEPGSGLVLHNAYASLRGGIERDKERAARREAGEQRAEQLACNKQAHEQYETARAGWVGLFLPERCHRVLNALGDDRLTRGEMIERMRAQPHDLLVYEGDLRRPLQHLLGRGEIERVKESRGGSKTAWRWRYHRRKDLGPKLRGLQRAFDDAGENR